MDPRSLVGLTQGARKRAARGIAAAEDWSASGDALWAFVWTDSPGHLTPHDRREARRAFHEAALSGAPPRTYAKHRATLRVGERLRPCPGPCSACCSGWCCKGGRALCDGSGVLPARGRR